LAQFQELWKPPKRVGNPSGFVGDSTIHGLSSGNERRHRVTPLF
jgi:hypothetical protein